jgi:shikimate kinase
MKKVLGPAKPYSLFGPVFIALFQDRVEELKTVLRKYHPGKVY